MLFPKSVLPFTIEINSVYIYFSKITNKCTKVWCDVASNSRNGRGSGRTPRIAFPAFTESDFWLHKHYIIL